MYKCSECGRAVIVLPNQEPIKACKCSAPIIAEATTTIKGKAKIRL